ncbi:DUF99 family protein [Halomicrobium salinisoli]|uniref:endonuclease dU n=1 Tax=Halomicrobium salinisoli TaxID=2878391 RepID=UPI001CEFD35B|nr:DUF99 family protein [Halomicrobium salinisoli]
MKAGVRALGVAESYSGETSTLAGSVVRASRVVDGFVFGECTVGESDATDAIAGMVQRLDREDVRYLLVSGVAPAWFNVVDLRRLEAAVDRPVLSVTYEASPGLEGAIREAFDDESTVEDRLATYRAQPERRSVSVNGETVYVRAVGVADGEAADVVRGFTPEGGRPEPLRVARLAARAAESFRGT